MQLVNESEVSVASRLSDASKRFARALVEASVFQRFEEAGKRLRDDLSAQQMLSEFQQAQQVLQTTRRWGGASPEEAAQLENSRQRMFGNPVLKEYFESQDELVLTLKELNIYMTGQLGFDFAGLARPAGGCC